MLVKTVFMVKPLEARQFVECETTTQPNQGAKNSELR